MAKWLKEGIDAGGFAIKKKREGRREGKKGKRKHSGSNSYSPSELSDSKEEATLGADFSLVWPKRRKKRRNSKNWKRK